MEDLVRKKEALMEVLEQAHEKKQKVAWVAGKEHDPLARLMGDMERSVDQKLEKVTLKHGGKVWNARLVG